MAFPPTREDRIETLEIVVQTYATANLLDERDGRGNTALNLLVQEGREAEIRLFAQASPTIRNDDGCCALDYAMRAYYTKPSLLTAMLTTFGTKVSGVLDRVSQVVKVDDNNSSNQIFIGKRNCTNKENITATNRLAYTCPRKKSDKLILHKLCLKVAKKHDPGKSSKHAQYDIGK